MTQDTNTTSGAADLRAEVAMIDAAMVEMTNITPPLKRSECARLLRAALAAGQATAAQPGAAYAALPEPDLVSKQRDSTMRYTTVRSFSESQMRAFADATCAIRAPHGQAPAGATLPEGWVPLVITHEGQYPEEVAYGPQRMMDRLGKWLRKYFDFVAAAKEQPEPAADLQEDQTQPWYDIAWKHGARRHASFDGDELTELSFRPAQFDAFCAELAPAAGAVAPAYKDSAPELHIGDSAFESWHSTYSPVHKSDKQRARDAYAAGMGDPLVMAAPAAVAGPSDVVSIQRQAFIRGWDKRGMAHQLKGTVETDERMRALMDIYFPRTAAPTTQPAPQQEAQEHVEIPAKCPYFGPSPHRDVWLEGWYAACATQPAPPQAAGKAVHQFRKQYCADWYDGRADHGDSGGPYEERTLYTAPQPTAQGDALDAARYRWLRHGDNDEKVLCNGPVAKDYWYLLRGEKLDAAIDAAIAAQEGK